MVPGSTSIDGRTVRFAISSNEDATGPDGPGSSPIWAVNVHGYFAGGGMYWRESAILAERMGWRVVNPCLPGFAGSSPMAGAEVGIGDFAGSVLQVLDHVGAGRCVVLGHSMGGAVAMAIADVAPERTLGIVYRDGVATPAWRNRHGLLVALVAAVSPDFAALADIGAAVALDFPDLLIGPHPGSTVRMTVPDARKNLLVTGRLVPIAAMLLRLDLRDMVSRVAQMGIPILPEWGCFDRIVTPAAAAEFSALVDRPTVWVPGGHSWMLPRPQGQADVLDHLDAGRDFMDEVVDRWRTTGDRQAGSPQVTTTATG